MQTQTEKKLHIASKFLEKCGKITNTGGGLYLSPDAKICSYRELLDDATFVISILAKEIARLESEKSNGT